MNQTVEIINQVLPIFLLLFLGNRIRVSRFIKAATVEDLKKIVVNISLPALLFVSFANIELDKSYLVLSGILFSLCVFLLCIGIVIKRILFPKHSYFPHMFSGFEYGMLGVSLFGSAYGLENIGYIAIVDLGHELYIWFVLVPLLFLKRGEGKSSAQIFGVLATNPVIIAIIAGLVLNGSGLSEVFKTSAVTGAIYIVLKTLSSLTIPLILFIVGYEITIRKEVLFETLKIVSVRYIVIIPIILTVNVFVIRNWLNLDKQFEIALFTLLILPSPFIIPLFMKSELVEEKMFINNILAVQTLLCVMIFTMYVMLHPTL